VERIEEENERVTSHKEDLEENKFREPCTIEEEGLETYTGEDIELKDFIAENKFEEPQII